MDAHEELEARLAQLQVVLDNMGEGVVILRPDGSFEVNEAYARIHGFASKAESGRRLSAYVGSTVVDAQGHSCAVGEWPADRVLRGETFSNAVYEITIPATHTRFVAAYSGAPITDDEGEVVFGVLTIHDVTAEHEVQHRLRDELETTRLLLDAAATLTAVTDVKEALTRLADIALMFTGLERAFVNLIDIDRRILTPVVPDAGLAAPSGPSIPFDHLSETSLKAICDQRTAILDYERPETPQRDREIAAANNSKLVLFVPLIVENAIVGHISLDEPGGRHQFSEREIALVEGIASQGAIVVQKAQLFEAEREAREAETERARRLETLHEIASIASESLNAGDIAQRCLDALAVQFDLAMGAVFVADEATGNLAPLASVGDTGGFLDTLPGFTVDSDYETARVYRSGMPVAVEDVDSGRVPAASRDAAETLEKRFGRVVRSYVSLPLKAHEKTIGILHLDWPTPHPFTKDFMEFVESVGNAVAIALDNAWLFEAEVAARQEAARELATTTVLLEAAGVLNKWTNLDSLLEQLADIALRSTPHSRVHVAVLSDDGSNVNIRASRGLDAFPSGTVVPFDRLSAPTQEALTTGQTRIVEFARLPEEKRGFADAYDSRLALIVPIRFEERVLGHIAIGDSAEAREFTDRESAILEGIASQAAVAIVNARLFEAEHEATRLSEALNAVNVTIHSTLEPDEVMQYALDEGVRVLDCDAGAIELLEGGSLVIRYQRGFSESDVGIALDPADAPNTMLAVDLREPFTIGDMSTNPALNVGFVRKQGIKSVLALPLIVRGSAVGAALFYTRTIRRFTNVEVDFGRKLGASVALGLENARLYAGERDIATRLQNALLTLPDSLQGIEFAHAYHSAAETAFVGGDFYDIFELNHHHIGITIGDVAGKGLQAAVLTSLVKNTVRAHASEKGKTPARILTLTNDLVFKSTPAESFATVFFAILDCRDGHLAYANAGHTTAAIVRKDGRCSKLSVTGPLLGAFEEATFDQSEAVLDLDELLFLYTDGLTEARGEGELYGEDRVFDFLSRARDDGARAIVSHAIDDVMSFTGGQLRDDLAILAVRRLEPGAETPVQQKLEM